MKLNTLQSKLLAKVAEQQLWDYQQHPIMIKLIYGIMNLILAARGRQRVLLPLLINTLKTLAEGVDEISSISEYETAIAALKTTGKSLKTVGAVLNSILGLQSSSVEEIAEFGQSLGYTSEQTALFEELAAAEVLLRFADRLQQACKRELKNG